MLLLAAIVLALTLAAAGGVLFFYAWFLEGAGRAQRRRIAELERANAALREELRRASARPAGPPAPEPWPEVIDEGGDLSLK